MCAHAAVSNHRKAFGANHWYQLRSHRSCTATQVNRPTDVPALASNSPMILLTWCATHVCKCG